ncbi:hypothetical protein Tco_0572089, partial [Tanacetum coccineum]
MFLTELPKEDFAKKIAELVNQRKKFFAEERAKAKRSKPMTQSLLRKESGDMEAYTVKE